MTEQEVFEDIQRLLCRLYMQHKGNRSRYEEAVVASADQMFMPADIKETYLKLALGTYDKMDSPQTE